MAKKKERLDDGVFEGQDEAKLKALDAALQDLTKRFGDGSIIRLGEAAHMAIDVIPTGSLGLDIALGVGGIPRGRVVEIYGPESSGKTTLCLHVIAEAQRRGGLAAFVDMEHALDPIYAQRLGVDVETLYVSQPDTGEQALEICEALVRSGAMDIVVVDSVAALVPRAEIEGEMGDTHVGLQARLMSQALRKLSGAIKQSNTAVMFTNQIREKVGVMYGCFRHDAPVLLADGSSLPISEIVEQKLNVEVMSYNIVTQQFEPRQIISWFDNGPTNEFLEFTVAAPYGAHRFACTHNHLLLTESGYVRAGELKIGERLVTAVEQSELVPEGPMFQANAYQPLAMTIENIQLTTAPGNNHRYDIEIEGNHCYVVDGVVVHNSPETQPGGRALKFYASVRLDIRRVQGIKQGGDTIGNRTRVRVTKNKVAPPFRETEFDIMFYESGISKTGEILDLGADLDIIEKRGAFFRYNDGLLGQGRENAKQFLVENPAISDEIENAVRVHFGLPSMVAQPEE